ARWRMSRWLPKRKLQPGALASKSYPSMLVRGVYPGRKVFCTRVYAALTFLMLVNKPVKNAAVPLASNPVLLRMNPNLLYRPAILKVGFTWMVREFWMLLPILMLALSIDSRGSVCQLNCAP